MSSDEEEEEELSDDSMSDSTDLDEFDTTTGKKVCFLTSEDESCFVCSARL